MPGQLANSRQPMYPDRYAQIDVREGLAVIVLCRYRHSGDGHHGKGQDAGTPKSRHFAAESRQARIADLFIFAHHEFSFRLLPINPLLLRV